MNSERQYYFKYHLDELANVVKSLRSLMGSCHIFAFTGSLGSGKSTLIQALLRDCGVDELITSPTFSYFNAYHAKHGSSFYHFDCYRVTTIDQFLELGFEEYLFQADSYVFIEWPEVIAPLFAGISSVCFVDIHHCLDDSAVRLLRMRVGRINDLI